MKVIILCANYEPGGAQRAVLKLCNGLNDHKIECECWFMHRKSFDFTDTSPILMLDKKISSISDVWKISRSINKGFREKKPDVVISFLPYANILGQFIALLCGVKKRISSHRNLSNKELSPVLKIFDFLWAHIGIYTGITAVSKSTKKSFNYYNKSVFNKIKIINNGTLFSPSVLPKNDCREKLGINESAYVLGNIGRLVEQKNQMLLINILPGLKNIQLVIVGKGELKSSLENRARELGVIDRLLIIDELDTSLIPHFLKAIDIFVMPSYFEGMSNALIEALSAGVPIVSSDVESQSDTLIRDSDNLQAGILISNDEPEKWIEQILKIKDNIEVRNDLSEKSLIRSKDFTIEHMVNNFIEML